MRLQAPALKPGTGRVWAARFECTQRKEGHPVLVDMRTRELADPVFEEALRRSIGCPQCGKTMNLVASWMEEPPIVR